MKLDGIGIKVGDEMYSLLCGWGTVCSVYKDGCGVNFGKGSVNFNTEGKMLLDMLGGISTQRSLYWNEIEIVPPKAKLKVKKYKWVLKGHDTGYDYEFVTPHCTTEELKTMYPYDDIVGKIEGTEVEVFE